jgi:hypothetical protein
VIFKTENKNRLHAGGTSTCIRDVFHLIKVPHSGGISQAETRIMAEQFQSMLSEPEQHLIRLMQEDLRPPQIALELELAQEEVIELGRKIGEKRKAFYTVA